MRVTLVRPSIGRPRRNKFEAAAIEPLQLGVLSALTPDDVAVRLFDDRMESIPFDEPTDLVALTVESFTARRAYEIAAQFRARGVPVVMGGMHPTLIPQEVALHADAVFVGDAEVLWGKLIHDARSGRLRRLYTARPHKPQENILPDRALFKGKGYLPLSLIQFSRGCPHSCSFCAPAQYFRGNHYIRAIDQVVREISEQRLKILLFVDDNFTANPKAAKELMRELIPLKVMWGSQASTQMIHDPELMELMARSGCIGHVVGVESTNEENLISMNKRHNLRSDLFELGAAFERYGLSIWAALTVGHDSDTPDSIARLVDDCRRAKFAYAAVNMLCPYPNTPFYERLAREGRLLYDGTWWRHPDYRFNAAPFTPARMTAHELTVACRAGWTRFYSPASIAARNLTPRRLLRNPIRTALNIFYNAILRRDFLLTDAISFGLDHFNKP